MNLRDLIISENENWVALNKPSGLLSIPDRKGDEISLKVMLKEKYGDIFTVHRLDKDTSGLIIFAKNAETHKLLSLQFEDRKTVKIYLGLVLGSLPEAKATIDKAIAEHPALNGTMIIHRKGKTAITDFEVITDFGIYTWVQFRIHTGRTHQIRIHMKDYGHPIAADPLYGDSKPVLVSALKNRYNLSKNEENERPILGRLGLHAYQLSFTDENGKLVELMAPIPKDMRATLQQLEKKKK